MAKQARRDISALVEKGKLETARIKTEGIISEDIHLELLELMELYAETLLARFALLDMPTREPDLSILPALTAIIHAAPRTELKELHILREMLMAKYGREFAQDVMDNKDSCVPDRVMAKLLVEAPDPKLVDLYIYEICRAYDVPFSSPHLPETKLDHDQQQEDEDEDEAQEVEAQVSYTTNATSTDGADSEKKQLKAKTDKDATSTNGGAKKTDGAATDAKDKPSAAPPSRKKTEKEEVDSLEARFAALKRR